jgi:hypothetical protein
MSIQKKSLISTLKTAKKANVASGNEPDAKGSKVSSMTKVTFKNSYKAVNFRSYKATSNKGIKHA